MKVLVQNSYCKIEGIIHPDADALLRQVMTYKNDIEAEKGQIFFQMKMAKKHNNNRQYHACKAALAKLEANEYVCLYRDGTFPTGLLNIANAALEALQVPFQLVDNRVSPGETAILRWQNSPWEPRYYQTEMIKLGLQAGRGVFEAAVGSGKSLVMANLIKSISCNSLVIVPSRGLSGQLYRDFCEWFGANNVQLLDAQKIRKLGRPKAISIVTVQSLGSLVKSGDFAKFAKDIDALYVDEVHHAGASTYTGLLKDLEHVYYRYGFSGTFLRNDNKTLEMWSFLSNVLYQYPAFRAIQEGFLTPVSVYMHGMDGKANVKYQTEYDMNYCANPELLEKITEITTSYGNNQILILVNKKDKCGLVIHEYLNSLGIDNSYISGDNDKDEINSTIRSFNDKETRVLIGSSVIGEGIDVRSTDHLLMCQGGKSEITMVQAAGRVLRLYEGKSHAYIHDFRFEGSRYMIKHADEREDIYSRNFQCPIDHF
jgi:superfamily II DNA or RNA helicase